MTASLRARLVETVCIVDKDSRTANLEKVLSRGFPVCAKSPERTDHISIVGAGPSVRDYLDELTGEIWAVNGAYDWLVSEGIIPTGFVGIDPLPGLAEYVEHAQPETTFYIASPCDISVFDRLDGFNVMLWHPQAEDMKYPVGEWVVGGGSSALTRAPFLAHLLGYRDMTIYGADSSFERGKYCYPWGSYKCDIDQPILWIKMNGEGPFPTEAGLLRQIAAMQAITESFGDKLKVKCGGLMGAFLKAPISDVEIEIDGTNPDQA